MILVMEVMTILTILILNILLPTADVVTDINLAIKLFSEGHLKMTTALTIPFLLNYIVCFYTFFRLTKSKKKYLFIFPLLDLYPQYGKTRLCLDSY